jgi:two-component system, NtrC family, response regulator AtoC
VKRILIIEDDALIRENLIELLTEEGFEASGAENGRVGLNLALKDPPALVLCDVRMPELDGYGVLEAIRGNRETRGLPFIFLSAKADRADVRTGMNLGADDYVTKPFTRAELLEAVRARLARVENTRPQESLPKVTQAASIVVEDPAMQGVYQLAAKAAQALISVLVLGETGVGKEVLAQTIHKLSQRREGPCLALNCAAISESLLEGELFGNERGAYTGASQARPGLLESANGGTVFLDEVGDLPLSIQVKLLRVLEERRILRVGGRTPVPIDVRFVSATNRDLEAEVSRGNFRQDLFYRLNGLSITIPPLRERQREILPLAQRFAESAARQVGREAPRISEEAAELLLGYAWPGNVRELKNVIGRAIVVAEDVIGPSALPDALRRSAGHPPPSVPPPSGAVPPPSGADVDPTPSQNQSLRGQLAGLERQRIMEALEKCHGNQTAAAELLGMSRRTLVSRLAEYDLPRPRKR